MEHETQSEDKKVHHITELDQIITTADIWFDNLVLPKMEKALDQKFQLYMVPVNNNLREFKWRVRASKFILFVLIIILFLLK